MRGQGGPAGSGLFTKQSNKSAVCVQQPIYGDNTIE